MNDAIIISDVHLGSNICQSKKLQKFLDNLPPTSSLIINGDLFDSLNFKRLQRSHWKILNSLRDISKHTNLIWVRGNHDYECADISHLIGAEFVNEFQFVSSRNIIMVLHGDIFDKFISQYPICTKIADQIYRLIQRYDAYFNTEYYYSGLAKRKSKVFLRSTEQICERAKIYAELHNADSIICGHTHFPVINTTGNIPYYNCGSWTEQNCSYISIKNGSIDLNYFSV